MKIVYLIIKILLIIGIILLKKTKEKTSIVSSIVLTILFNFSLNVFACYILKVIDLVFSLKNLAIIYLPITLLVYYKIYKDKEIQKFYFDKNDLIAAICFLILIFGLVVYINGWDFGAFEYGHDYTVHFQMMNDYITSNKLEGRHSWYSNAAIMVETFINNQTVYRYRVVKIFDYTIMSLIGFLCYKLINIKKNLADCFISIGISMLILLAYPLNALLFGFNYLYMGIMFILAQLYIIAFSKMNKTYKYIAIFLLNFSIVHSYYYLAIGLYLGLLIYYIIKWKKDGEKIFNLEHILFGLICFAFPFLDIIISDFLLKTNKELNERISAEGAIYKSYFFNSTFLIPFLIYSIKDFKKDKTFPLFITILAYVLFTILTFFVYKKGHLSEYGFFKTYYILAPLVFVFASYGIFKFIKKYGYIKSLLGIGAYFVIMLFIYSKLIYKEVDFNPTIINNNEVNKANPLNMLEVYKHNEYILWLPAYMNKNYFEILEYIYNNIEDRDCRNVCLVGYEKYSGVYSCLVDTSEDTIPKLYLNVPVEEQGFKYILYDKKFMKLRNRTLSINPEKWEVVMENDYGILYKLVK